jgi:predicted nuclease of predicted toxin-antitoxin system
MRIKLDENLPQGLAERLSAAGHEVDTVPEEGIAGTDDEVVWQAAQDAGRFLVTQDLDFSDVRRYAPGTHRGLLLVGLRTASAAALTRRIEAIFATEAVEEWQRCFVVATDHKVRLRRPPGVNDAGER